MYMYVCHFPTLASRALTFSLTGSHSSRHTHAHTYIYISHIWLYIYTYIYIYISLSNPSLNYPYTQIHIYIYHIHNYIIIHIYIYIYVRHFPTPASLALTSSLTCSHFSLTFSLFWLFFFPRLFFSSADVSLF